MDICRTLNIRSIWDNEGETYDRYTIVLNKPYHPPHVNSDVLECLGLSEDPTHPRGFSQFCSCQEGKHLGKKIDWDELPKRIRDHITSRLSQEVCNEEVNR